MANVGEMDFNRLLTDSLGIFFKNALRVSISDPAQAFFFTKTIRWQRKAAKLRSQWEEKGFHVPPILVFSITSRCNLSCQGCYHRTLRGTTKAEIGVEKVKEILAEAKELGISFVVFGGGEPLMRKEIIALTEGYPEMLFMVFTNGLLIDSEFMGRMRRQRNLIPFLSMEGYQDSTDGRRGTGVYGRLQRVISALEKENLFWGTSLTVTRANFESVTNRSFVGDLVRSGCRIFFFVEYTPVKEGTEGWVITPEQRSSMVKIRDSLRSKFPAWFIMLPGDEEEIGGCLSAGKGFVHISAEGDVEPCPFVPYSDMNLSDVTLREALQSKFLKSIRESSKELHETEGGCALWARRAWLQSLTKVQD
ncbi:MAG: radical SAM protein [Candidatus Verstraetearchaeota archaeon]|nr:radical SAM protein [Candidatus Verstraetearchaeota archaeon]